MSGWLDGFVSKADLTTLLVRLSTVNGTGDPEDAYEQALRDVAAGMGIDLQAALEASVPVLPPLERTEMTPWRRDEGDSK
jgi:hypothetical protein